MDLLWLPVRRHWRLNERHYGALQGKDKKQTAEEFGGAGQGLAAQLRRRRRRRWTRRPPTTPPRPALPPTWPPELLPGTECLKDVVERMLPYWYDAIVPDLRPAGGCSSPPTATACGPW